MIRNWVAFVLRIKIKVLLGKLESFALAEMQHGA